jgi:hypothetical protein
MLEFLQILTIICQILIVLANLFGCYSGETLELLRQMTLAREADL